MRNTAAQKQFVYCINMLVYTYLYIYAYILIFHDPSPKYVLFFIRHE
jgi:hypothetical protein